MITNRHENQLYQDAFHHDSVGKAILEPEGGWIKVNQAFCRTLEHTEEQLLKRHFLDLLFLTGDHKSILGNITGSRPYLEMELPVLTGMGRDRWVQLHITGIFTPEGSVRYFIVQLLDISDRKQVERQIRRLNAEMNLILDSVAEGIYGIDLDTNVIFWNSAAEQMTGFRYSEFSSKSMHELLHHTNKKGQAVPLQDCPIYQALNSGSYLYVQDDVFWRKDGSSFPVEYTVNPIFDNDRYIGTVIAFTDITDRIKAKDHMIKSEKLSIAGQLAAGIAHEIRNPLTSLKGFIRLLYHHEDRKEYYLSIMEVELSRIEQILTELLMLAKPQSVQYNRRSLTELLEQVAYFLEPLSILKNVQIVLESVGEVWIECDENQIKQVLINLIKNAVESMPEGGTVTAAAASLGTGTVQLTVQDQGVGIPEQKLKQLGEPFYTTKDKGTGLGLMVSFKIIENHQGKIEAFSEVGKGTLFRITLPEAGGCRPEPESLEQS
jgi:PAS domain S-box-containing protein